MLNTTAVPRWLSALLSEKFFNACIIHEDAKKNEKNYFCFDCCEAICPCCFPNHLHHRLLRIRKYVYNDVIELVNAKKLMDCDLVQCYISNNSKVIFLNKRPQTRPPRSSGNTCTTCGRNLQASSIYCSLSCKLQHILKSGCKLSMYLRQCEFLDLPEPGLEDGQMTSDSVLEQTGSLRTDSGSSSAAAGLLDCSYLSCTATTEVVKKKRSNLPGCLSAFRPARGPVCEVSESTMNRRKGAPHRSPLH